LETCSDQKGIGRMGLRVLANAFQFSFVTFAPFAVKMGFGLSTDD